MAAAERSFPGVLRRCTSVILSPVLIDRGLKTICMLAQSEEDDDQEALQLLAENGQLKNFLHEANQQQELQAATIQALVCERERLRAEVDLSQDALACAKQLPIIPLVSA